jgi:hypothetical protein
MKLSTNLDWAKIFQFLSVSGLLLLNLTVEVPLAGLPSAATKPP